MSARRQAILRPPRGGAPYVGMLSGVLIVVAAFLPWYATNLGPPFSAESVAGWEATNVARASVFMGAVVAVASAVAALEARGGLRLGPLGGRRGGLGRARRLGHRRRSSWATGSWCSPSPAEFLSRQIGVYLAAAGAVGGILSGLALIATRDWGSTRRAPAGSSSPALTSSARTATSRSAKAA